MSLLQQSISSMKMFDGYYIIRCYILHLHKKKTLIEEIKQSQFY